MAYMQTQFLQNELHTPVAISSAKVWLQCLVTGQGIFFSAGTSLTQSTLLSWSETGEFEYGYSNLFMIKITLPT